MLTEEAKAISKEFSKLTSYGAIVRNYNSRKSFSSAQSGWVDHMIIYKDMMYLIEIKVGNDRLSLKQLELAETLHNHFYTEVFYFIISSLDEAKEFVDILLDSETTEHELWRFTARTEAVLKDSNARLAKKENKT